MFTFLKDHGHHDKVECEKYGANINVRELLCIMSVIKDALLVHNCFEKWELMFILQSSCTPLHEAFFDKVKCEAMLLKYEVYCENASVAKHINIKTKIPNNISNF
ncbi:hypothetical protein CDAR_488681 [Caerostris darwini]|uniref:Uncharacterized protein n=1 Tax=Caerostris darwini TaxID=1538125 RepID=A0AAV4SB53_9ARAC|nr:hypothetical protein CDAR_488681 [Caerostris darwini]